METLFIHLALVVFGLIIGSFLTVCIYRIPYGRPKGPGEFALSDEELEALGESQKDEDKQEDEQAPDVTMLKPARSFCPECRKQLKWYHNIPLLSWLILGGKCAYCGSKISLSYPIIELLSVLSCVLAYQAMPDPATAGLVYLFCCGLIVITFIDLDYFIIPDVISFPGMAVAVAAAAANNLFMHYYGTLIFKGPVVENLVQALWGLLAGGGFLFLVAKSYHLLRHREGLGLGDVKLLAVIGLFFGYQAAVYTIFVGSVIGTVFGVLQLALQGQKLSRPLPFGPYLAAAALLYLFTDPALPFALIRGLLSLDFAAGG